jgi:hypothetical protein
MRPLLRLSVMVGVLVLLAGCMGSDPSASPTFSQESATPAEASTAPSDAPSSDMPRSSEPVPTTEPVASDDLGAFSCDTPIIEDGTVAVANIVDVRVGTHDGYDRVVFEFEQGTPELNLDRAEPPFTQDGSGLPIDVDGNSFLGLVMRGGTKQTDAGTSSYDGSTDIAPGFPALVHLIEGGDFERQSTWYLGLTGESCVRVLLLDAPPRLVIDVEH